MDPEKEKWTSGHLVNFQPDQSSAAVGDDDEEDDDEPTSVLKMVESFRESRRLSQMSSRPKRDSGLFGPVPQQPKFEPGSKKRFSSRFSMQMQHGAKIPKLSPKLGPDPLEGLSMINAASSSVFINAKEEELQKEVNRLKNEMSEKDRKMSDLEVQNTRWRSQNCQLELQLKEQRIQSSSQKEKFDLKRAEIESKFDREKSCFEAFKKKVSKEREIRDILKDKKLRRERDDVETEVEHLEEKNQDLEDELSEIQGNLDEEKRLRISEENSVRREKAKNESLMKEIRGKENSERISERKTLDLTRKLNDLQSELNLVKLENEKLQREARNDEDFVKEKKILRQNLLDYPNVVAENKELKRMNDLYKETLENEDLLKQRISDLNDDLMRSEKDLCETREAANQLQICQRRLRQWEDLTLKFLSREEKAELEENDDDITVLPNLLESKLAEMQRNSIVFRGEEQEVKNDLHQAQIKLEEIQAENNRNSSELKKLKVEKETQTQLVKSLQRKLFLAAKERDSLKSVMDSYEKELTFTGGQIEQNKINQLEETLRHYKVMNERLEKVIAVRQPQTTATEKVAVEEEKVFHMKQNPLQMAQEDRQIEVNELRKENDSLKARVKLLESGQSADLTLLTGQKVEATAEVKELQEQLGLAEIKKDRLIEAFKQTSKKFREVVCQLTGFRIDGKEDNKYVLSPVYAENPDSDRFLFQYENDQCHLMDTNYSSQWGEFVDLHLKQQRSIPIFLSAVLTDLFSRQTFDTMDFTCATTTNPTQAGPSQPEQEQLQHQQQPQQLDDDDDSDELICLD